VLLNPGSVGFPRDKTGPASYALLDTEKREVTFRSVTYEVDATRRKLDEMGYPAFVKGFLDQWT
jgi:diadenosine tetraphosphatase ApaH/serine/threonine PP2A family protein phosphatase